MFQFLSFTGKVKFKDEIESIKSRVEELKKEGISIFIALGHSGYNADIQIAKNVPDIDLVVGGHTNTFLYNGKYFKEDIDNNLELRSGIG